MASGRAKYRLAAKPGDGKQFRVVIQRRRWMFFWTDWYPVENAVRSLQQEFIEHYERMQEILDELKDANAWVEQAYKQIDFGHKAKGVSASFEADVMPQEWLKPDPSSRFKEVQALVTQGQGRQRPGGGTRTMFIGQFGKRFDFSSLNKEKLAEDFNPDHIMDYRTPQQDQHGKSKGKQGNQNQQNKGQDNH